MLNQLQQAANEKSAWSLYIKLCLVFQSFSSNFIPNVSKDNSPLDCKEIKPVNPKGNQPWIFTEKTDAEAEAPILQLPDAKSWVIGKDPDAGKYWRQEEKGTTEDEMVGWHHQLNGHAFRQTGRRWRTGEPGAAVHEVAKSQTWLSYRTSGDAFS